MHGETLFHFTNELSKLLSILNDRAFKVSFSLETLSYRDWERTLESIPELWVPMVSFCDYKLSEIAHHTLNYGQYGLGMSKKWGIEKGLNPVLYVSERSLIGQKLRGLLNHCSQERRNSTQFDETTTAPSVAEIETANFYAWTKNYQGTLVRKGVRHPDFRFADDKEWRFVAEIDYARLGDMGAPFGSGYNFLPSPSVICDCCGRQAQHCDSSGHDLLRQRKQEYSELITSSTSVLEFEFHDIRFVLVKTSTDRDKFLDWCEGDPGFNERQRLQLAAKLVVIDELDFRELAPVAGTANYS